MVLDSAIGLKINIKPQFSMVVNFVLVPELSEPMIFGNDTLATLGAQITYFLSGLTFLMGEEQVAVETVMYTFLMDDPLSENDQTVVPKLNAIPAG